MATETTPDPFLAHEALDRAALVASTFEDWIECHPYVQADPELKAGAERTMRALSEFHQAVGAKALA